MTKINNDTTKTYLEVGAACGNVWWEISEAHDVGRLQALIPAYNDMCAENGDGHAEIIHTDEPWEDHTDGEPYTHGTQDRLEQVLRGEWDGMCDRTR